MDRSVLTFALLGASVAYLGFPANVCADEVVLSPTHDQDVRILSNAATSNHALEDILSVYHRSDNVQNSLLQFDLSPIPSGRTITQAKLTLWRDSALFFTGDNGIDTEVFRVTQPWANWQLTWNNASGVRPSNFVVWKSPGGDFAGIKGLSDGSDPYAGATLNIGDGSPGIFELDLDVTHLVNQWYIGVFRNYGFLLTAPEGNGLHFHADRGANPLLYPTLTVNFQ
jgi:hypothetical protein